MILIADSGSTKADWMLVDEQGKELDTYNTVGFNPFFHDDSFILNELHDNHKLKKIAPEVKMVHFYGAGCSSPDRQDIVKEAFSNFFTSADIFVRHDLEAAAYSTGSEGPCIACILGTGSNSCYYDGENVSEVVPALGYVLGDEGSGSALGKRLLTAYLYKKLPERIHKDLENEYEVSKESIFRSVYYRKNANVYLASFSRFLSSRKDDPYIQEMVAGALLEFLATHVCRYPNFKELTTHFIGSIAFYYEDILRDAAERRLIKVGKIIKKPIHGLVDYHVRNFQKV